MPLRDPRRCGNRSSSSSTCWTLPVLNALSSPGATRTRPANAGSDDGLIRPPNDPDGPSSFWVSAVGDTPSVAHAAVLRLELGTLGVAGRSGGGSGPDCDSRLFFAGGGGGWVNGRRGVGGGGVAVPPRAGKFPVVRPSGSSSSGRIVPPAAVAPIPSIVDWTSFLPVGLVVRAPR